MRALLRVMSLLLLAAAVSCGGNGAIATIGLPQSLLYVVGTGSNTIQGFQLTTLGQVLSLGLGSFPTNPIPVAMALTPSRGFLYVPNSTANTVSGFTVNHTTGVLTPVGTAVLPTPVCSTPATCNFNPVGAAVDSSGQFLIVLNQGSVTPAVAPSISVFNIDPVRGLLTQVAGSPFAAPAGAQFVVASPNAALLYVSTSTGAIAGFSISASGALSAVAGSPFAVGVNIRGMVIDPKGQFLYAPDNVNNNVASFSIQSSGTLSAVAGSPFATGMQPVAVIIDATGTFLYVANQGSNNVSAFKVASGVPAEVKGSPFATAGSGVITPTQPTGLAIDPTNAFLLVADQGSRDIASFTINSADGTLSMVTNSPFGLTIAPTFMLTTR